MIENALLTVCPHCRGVWLKSMMRGKFCHVCASKFMTAAKMQPKKTSHVVQRRYVASPSEAKRGIKEAGVMRGVLEGEVRRL
jgi:Zn-finger nucleic acid-binding protein